MNSTEQVIGALLSPLLIIGTASCIRVGWELGGFVWRLFTG